MNALLSAPRTIGILVFTDAEELDFVGPFEVFTMANEMAELLGREKPFEVVLISENGSIVKCRKGMRVETEASFSTAPKLDILLVPGGQGTRAEVHNPVLLDWIAKVSETCEWVTSVCTGSMLLAAAGPANGKTVTTHWAFVEELRNMNLADKVRDDVRYVRDGNVLTSAGVSAGIDMALWLVGEIADPQHARDTQRGMQYDPCPPYAGAV